MNQIWHGSPPFCHTPLTQPCCIHSFSFPCIMSTLLDEDDPPSNELPAPLEPIPLQRQLPHHILRRIFKLLPVPSLAHVALASRDFKSLAYEDAIWSPMLHDILKNDSSNLSDMLGNLLIV